MPPKTITEEIDDDTDDEINSETDDDTNGEIEDEDESGTFATNDELTAIAEEDPTSAAGLAYQTSFGTLLWQLTHRHNICDRVTRELISSVDRQAQNS
ncbi:hypothetical protein J4E85_002080 [Alternaria conjuncta]|uniref:uncharacterized protein n=1 Tax=Alternaria conjuncta TaxID=181017 RepID=UPI00221EB767|nr:uncharacterized protein J4E85_002080 [Alternaria conjuncta]KAI4934224.1 hypothetical protein J4E85_002080 [Alternaria conjuncta]